MRLVARLPLANDDVVELLEDVDEGRYLLVLADAAGGTTASSEFSAAEFAYFASLVVAIAKPPTCPPLQVVRGEGRRGRQ